MGRINSSSILMVTWIIFPVHPKNFKIIGKHYYFKNPAKNALIGK